MSEFDDARPSWTFLTNHARVLAVIARDPDARVRDIAATCLLTERTVQGILADLEEAGYLRRTKTGRRNTYEVTPGTSLRHPADLGRAVADALGLPEDAFHDAPPGAAGNGSGAVRTGNAGAGAGGGGPGGTGGTSQVMRSSDGPGPGGPGALPQVD
ncbi:helix-turn-helix transcriptional regulator [Streptodolium elevatio]